jgi:septum formation protein
VLLLILASGSPRRKKLLSMLGLSFKVIPSEIEEIIDPGKRPSKIVKDLAYQKGISVANNHPDSLVIAADTIVVLNNKVLGQPDDKSEAIRMLQSLSGRTHEVYTGVALIKTGKYAEVIREIRFYERTKVSFASLLESEILEYVKSGSPMDKAGAYGIQDERGALYISGIEGDYYNVVGLPIHKFYQKMKLIAPEIFHKANIETS